MKKLVITIAALSLLGIACSREETGLNSRVDESSLRQEQDMGAATGTGYEMEDEAAADMDMNEGSDIQREEELGMEQDIRMQDAEVYPDSGMIDENRGLGTEAGSSDASGMGMDE